MRNSSSPFYFIVLNPAAGSVSDQTLAQLHAALEKAAVEYHVHETQIDDDVQGIVAEAVRGDPTAVVAAGGDGTISEVANALHGTSIPLGILPMGTGNVLAQELEIPLSLEEALQVILTSTECKSVDAMQIDDRLYFSHVSLGIYANVIQDTSVESKKYIGRLAYIWQAIKKIQQRRSWIFQINVDNQPLRVQASVIMIANAGSFGIGGLQWGEQISLADGVIDVCIIRAQTPFEYLQALMHIASGSANRSPMIAYHHATKTISVSTKKKVPVRADGEIIGEQSAKVTVIPHAVQVVVK